MVRFDIDLTFSTDAHDGFHGTVTAAGNEVHIQVSDPSQLPTGGGLRSLADLRVVAAALAKRGVIVSLEGPSGLLVSLGAVSPRRLRGALLRSPHIRLGRLSAIRPLLRGRRRDPEASALSIPAPPTTPFPIAPTLDRRVRRRASTTHYTPGSGRPRLIFVIGSENWDGSPPREFDLLPGRTTIGSGPDADLRLPGLAALHAEVRHDGRDEYVLHEIEPTGGGAIRLDAEGAMSTPSQSGRVLRTGARIDLGEWRLAYFREEFADHGRPFGGRLGGELSVQKRQPPRPGTRKGAGGTGGAAGGSATSQGGTGVAGGESSVR